MKVCSVCEQELPDSSFYKDKKSKDGLFSKCKACQKAWRKAYYAANSDRAKAYTKQWVKDNPEKVLAMRRRRYERLLVANGNAYREAFIAWGKAVKHRDDYICQHCHTDLLPEEARAHHIVPKAQFPQYMFDVDNGITLCHPCHMAEHHNKPTT